MGGDECLLAFFVREADDWVLINCSRFLVEKLENVTRRITNV